MSDMWHVRGMREETTRRAKVAAAAAGMKMGEWLTRAIEKYAADTAPGKIAEYAPEWGGRKEAPKISGNQGEGQAVAVEVKSDPAPVKRKRPGCAHGVPKGHHCWQCGGKAAVEA